MRKFIMLVVIVCGCPVFPSLSADYLLFSQDKYGQEALDNSGAKFLFCPTVNSDARLIGDERDIDKRQA